MSEHTHITLHPVTEADDEFLLAVYGSTRAEELARVPWTAEQKEAFVRMQFIAQKQHYAAEYPLAGHEIIRVNGTPAGRIYLDRSGHAFHILDITILPQHRKLGVGSRVLRQIMEAAADAGKPVTIYLEHYNPAQTLFARLGFERVKEMGLHVLLSYLAPKRSEGPL